MTRVYGLGRNDKHHYPSYAPKVIFHRVRHWAIGPLLGCSCSRCFRSRWRIAYSNEVIDRQVRSERAIKEIDRQLWSTPILPNYKRSFPQPRTRPSDEERLG